MSPVYPRTLKYGRRWYGQSKIEGEWRRYNTHSSNEKTALKAVSFIDDHCPTWDRVKVVIVALARLDGRDEAILELLDTLRAEVRAGSDPISELAGTGSRISRIRRRFLDAHRGAAEGTLYLYNLTFDQLTEALGDVPVQTINRAALDTFVAHLTERGALHRNRERKGRMQPQTLHGYFRRVRAFLRWCADPDGGGVPGMRPPKIPAVTQGPPARVRVAFTPDEVTRLIRAAGAVTLNGQSLQRFIAFLVASGLRRGEALAMDWSAVNLAEGYMTVENRKAGRVDVLPITRLLRAVLDAFPEPRRGLLFPGLTESTSRSFKAVCEAAGVPYRSLHRLRATFAVNLARGNLDPMSLGRMARHRQIQTTFAHYFSPGLERLREAADSATDMAFVTAMEQALGKFHVEQDDT